MSMSRGFIIIYLAFIALMTVFSYAVAGLSITSLIVTAAFIINVFLFADVFISGKNKGGKK